jgi:hypothetical protein
LQTLHPVERRVLVDLNKNPAGLMWLIHNPASAVAFLADRSAGFKSILARMVNTAGGPAGAAAGASTVTLHDLAQQGQSPQAPPQ